MLIAVRWHVYKHIPFRFRPRLPLPAVVVLSPGFWECFLACEMPVILSAQAEAKSRKSRDSFEGNQPGMLPQTVTTVWRTELGTTLVNGFNSTTDASAYFPLLGSYQSATNRGIRSQFLSGMAPFTRALARQNIPRSNLPAIVRGGKCPVAPGIWPEMSASSCAAPVRRPDQPDLMGATPRPTRLGHHVTRFSLDQLPRRWNVVRGDMSLVGPRPAVPGGVEHYQRWQRRRQPMRPGLTCPCALKGRDELGFEARTRKDVEYIDTRSLALDWKILRLTIPRVLSGGVRTDGNPALDHVAVTQDVQPFDVRGSESGVYEHDGNLVPPAAVPA